MIHISNIILLIYKLSIFAIRLGDPKLEENLIKKDINL